MTSPPSPGGDGQGTTNDVTTTCITPCNQDALSRAASQARAIAGSAYFTGVSIDTAANKVDIYLAHAPRSVIDQIKAKHPRVYVFHAAEHTWAGVMKLMDTVAKTDLEASGIIVRSLGPTQDGHLVIGIKKTPDFDAATKKLNAMFGANWIKVVVAPEAVAAISEFSVPTR